VPSVPIKLADGQRIRAFVDEGCEPVIDMSYADLLERRDLGLGVPYQWPVGVSSTLGQSWLIRAPSDNGTRPEPRRGTPCRRMGECCRRRDLSWERKGAVSIVLASPGLVRV
jgi:hypothetical protein